VVIYTST